MDFCNRPDYLPMQCRCRELKTLHAMWKCVLMSLAVVVVNDKSNNRDNSDNSNNSNNIATATATAATAATTAATATTNNSNSSSNKNTATTARTTTTATAGRRQPSSLSSAVAVFNHRRRCQPSRAGFNRKESGPAATATA